MTEPSRQIVGIPVERRLKSCVENWPGCYEGGYDPSCCRFPKSCSCTIYDPERVKEEDLEPMTEADEWRQCDEVTCDMYGKPVGTHHVHDLPMDEDPTTKGVLTELGRIADALEAQVRPKACDEPHVTGAKCVLDDRHVGHHVTADGRYHWLDDD